MQLESAAQLERQLLLVEPILAEAVLVGGATIALWLSDPAASPARPTNDIDLVLAIRDRVTYYRTADRLRALGLAEDEASGVLCRWRHQQTGAIFDVMPLAREVLGFSNEWYELAHASAREVQLPGGLVVRAATPPVLLATKFVAFDDRGRHDYLASRDMHDIMALLDGRPELIGEVAAADATLAAWLAVRFQGLLEHGIVPAALGYLPTDEASQRREGHIIEIARRLATPPR